MSKIAIVTDSNSGITQEEGRRLGVSVIPMPFFINEKMYLEGITLRQDEFYQWLKSDASISTSQPSPGETMGLWDNLLKEYDEVVHIPMSSGLSASCDTATMLSRDYDGKVEVVNNQRISVTQRQSVLDALVLRDAGKSAAEIKAKLEEEKMESSIYITLETLKYLKKGGTLVYSTCTFDKNENSLQIKRFMSEHGGFTVAEEKQFLPDGTADGFYCCKIIKND